jgi:hypothetical protein
VISWFQSLLFQTQLVPLQSGMLPIKLPEAEVRMLMVGGAVQVEFSRPIALETAWFHSTLGT